MADTASFELLPVDYSKVTMSGYVRKIKLKNESYTSVEKNREKYQPSDNGNTTVAENKEEIVVDQAKRAELISRLEEKISVVIPDFSRVESLKNRAIKIKTAWRDNCYTNAGMLFDNMYKTVPEETVEEEIQEIEPIEEAPVEEYIEEQEAIDNVDSSEELSEETTMPESSDNIVEEIAPVVEDIPVETEVEIVTKNSERAITPGYDENGEQLEQQYIELIKPKLPEIPKVELQSLLVPKIEEDNIISSDNLLDSDVESDISEQLEETQEENVFEENDKISDIISNSTEIDDIKAALESIKQKKAEQEKVARAKQEAEEARREEEAKLEEIKRKNLEAVEKLKAQREAISEEIEQSMRREEEERLRTEEIKRQIELQEQLFGELESEIDA